MTGKASGKFDIGEAIVTPWKLPGGRNFLMRIVLWAAGLQLVAFAILGRGLIEAYGELLVQLPAINTGEPSPEQSAEFLSIFMSMMGPAFLMILVGWVVTVMFETAMHKNVFRGTDHGVFPFRFGKDEGRVMLAQFVISLCIGLVYIVGIILIALIIAAMALVSPVIGGIAAVLLVLAFIIVLVIVAMRLAPAAAMSVRDDTQRIFEGSAITKGMGWPLFGSYAIAFIAVMMLSQALMSIGAFIAFGNLDAMTLMNGTGADPEAIMAELSEKLNSPITKIMLVVSVMLYMVFNLLAYLHIYGIANHVVQVDSAKKNLG